MWRISSKSIKEFRICLALLSPVHRLLCGCVIFGHFSIHEFPLQNCCRLLPPPGSVLQLENCGFLTIGCPSTWVESSVLHDLRKRSQGRRGE
ncbi:hypothetical protein SLEP1_g26339 [Rubroshorea leprosula]|uniref:Secreted protein n=1 Tax=Rubroshorea leprosula TaxID=152421 RepID=A0AAV5JVD0_9ROSI|nr:hypothetical protein SLEP1_g26339 [Rubroshorea leprosula]